VTPDDQLVKLTVLLTPKAYDALVLGAQAAGCSKTDFVNASLLKTEELMRGLSFRLPWWLRWLPINPYLKLEPVTRDDE
jgi:hypothetical protein